MNFKTFTRREQCLTGAAALGFLCLFTVCLARHQWVLFIIAFITAVLTILLFIRRSQTLLNIIPEETLRRMENDEAVHSRQISELSSSLEDTRAQLANVWDTVAKEREHLCLSAILPPASGTERINLVDAAREAIDTLKPFAKSSHIRMQLSASLQSVCMDADRGWIKIMLLNIIDNSIKYMQQPGTLVITVSLIGTDIFLILKDNGAGLPEQEVAHIFEINYQGSNRQSGNGLGLAQSKAIIEYYGGTVYAKSALGRGMAIYIQLPSA